jgi:hypothetical protein
LIYFTGIPRENDGEESIVKIIVEDESGNTNIACPKGVTEHFPLTRILCV